MVVTGWTGRWTGFWKAEWVWDEDHGEENGGSRTVGGMGGFVGFGKVEGKGGRVCLGKDDICVDFVDVVS